EEQLLEEVFKIDHNLLAYLPFMSKPVLEELLWIPEFDFENRQDFISIGNFLHQPNLDGVVYLKESIWPLIREALPEAKVYICGSYITQRVLEMHNEKEGFIVLGRIEDVSASFHRAKLSLAPLRFGAGIKTKLIMSIQSALPSVTTSIGAEGIAGDYPWPGAIADTPEVFAKAAIELYSDKAKWEKAREYCIPIINNRFNELSISKRFKTQLETIIGDLETHRKQNFIGQLLQHHTLQSTKYLSKWIEEKNK
ncbi:MAG: glycosyltransferase, partial [Flavobacteriaceae bacterium]|nr:glycosyltransferase [Flavobacteriaceae bacterium]